jgi:hypothetical protein
VRFSLLRLASLAPVASVLCTALAFGQNLPNNGISASDVAQPNAYSAFYSDAANAQPRGPLAPAPPTAPTAGLAQANENWLRGNYFSQKDGLNDLKASCDNCPNWGVVAFVNYDSWKGISDGGWQNNGLSSGLNFGTRLGRFSDWTGIGFQIGGSAAAYNWSGTDFRLQNNNEAQPQGFVTYGLFRKANENSNWSAALVQDWMLNSNFSVFAQNPTLSQWRGQLGYATSAWNEFGIWGTWRGHGDSRNVDGFGTVSWRAVNQISGFAHHKWGLGGADTWLWVGLPENNRLAGGGSLGDYLIGLAANVPLNDLVSLYTLLTYMHPSTSPGPSGFDEEAWNFTVGLSFYPGRNARSNTVAGQCWMPMLPVANNGLFLVDASQTF